MTDENRSHPDAERLAEYAEGQLPLGDRTSLEHHLASCDECRAAVAQAMTFIRAQAGDAEDWRVPTAAPFWSRARVRNAASAVALAAMLVVAIRIVRPSWLGVTPRGDRPELQGLIAALANEPTRPIAGRLTGGFMYAPPAVVERGGSERRVSPDVITAVAAIERSARRDGPPAARATLATALLARGAVDESIDLFDGVTRDAPNESSFLIDAGAAYLERARIRNTASDWAKALALTDRSLKATHRPEALFNRALALEGLHLRQEAIEAWLTVQKQEAGTGWAREADLHLSVLRRLSNRAATPRRHQEIREDLEEHLLGDWGTAVVRGDPASLALLDQAGAVAEALASSGGDSMPLDSIARIRRLPRTGSAAALAEFAHGHVAFAEARREYRLDHQQRARELMNQASAHFTRVDSPYRWWAPVLDAIALRSEGQNQAAVDRLHRLSLDQLAEGFHHLRGRIAWARGVALDELGRYDLGRAQLEQAVAEFRRADEVDNLIATRTILADAEWFLGNRMAAWDEIGAVLEDVQQAGATRRNYHLAIAATLAIGDRLPEAAIAFQTARVRVVDSPRFEAEAYLQRARTEALLGEDEAALGDVARADEAVARIADPALKRRNAADVSMARAELLSRSDCRRAIDEATTALAYIQQADPVIRLGGLLTLRARCHRTLGDVIAARADLSAAIAAFESKRSGFTSPTDRVQAFDSERSAFKDLIAADLADAPDGSTALRTAERERSGVLLERWSTPEGQLDPLTAHASLPPDVAVVYFEVLTDRVLAWVLTRERVDHLVLSIDKPTLARWAEQIDALVYDGAGIGRFGTGVAPMMRRLMQPVLDRVGDKGRIAIIPDGPLFGVPFAALPDPSGRPLLATRLVVVAPSFTTFVRASERLVGFDPSEIVAIGDGHDLRTSDLPWLPRADAEAQAVAQIYPKSLLLTASQATRRRFLGVSHRVVHFAGHSVVSRDVPMLSRLLFAPDTGDDGGLLFADEIARTHFDRTRVVVLASCEGAAGRAIDGEGVLSLARAFFAAGVPAVIASLWPVSDDSEPFVTTFHRELRVRRGPAEALRAAQLKVLANRGGDAPLREWAGFLAFGGL